MRKKTIALVLAMVMLLTLALSGCGDNNNTSSGSTDTSGTSSTTTSGTTSTDDGASTGTLAAAGITTEVGTPREETLIVETQTPTDTPGQFNTYMTGTTTGMGIHQLMSAHLWEMDSVKGEQFPEVAADMGTPNEDYTEWTVKIREGIKWS